MKRTLTAILLMACCACAPHPRTAPGGPSLQVPNLEERTLLLPLVDRQAYDELIVHQSLKRCASLREDLAIAFGRIPDREGRLDAAMRWQATV